jgi:lysozyme
MTEPVRQKPGAGTAAFVALTLALAGYVVKPWEGKSNAVYADIVRVPTVCYGHTGKDVHIGQGRRTNDDCSRLLTGDLSVAYRAVARCITVPIAPQTAAALTSFVFNVGPGGVCSSRLQLEFNAGRPVSGCGQLMHWVYAGGQRVQGLANRREAEYALCMEGVKS